MYTDPVRRPVSSTRASLSQGLCDSFRFRRVMKTEYIPLSSPLTTSLRGEPSYPRCECDESSPWLSYTHSYLATLVRTFTPETLSLLLSFAFLVTDLSGSTDILEVSQCIRPPQSRNRLLTPSDRSKKLLSGQSFKILKVNREMEKKEKYRQEEFRYILTEE